MDIDCDGANRTGGKCANDPTGQGQTAFKSEIQAMNVGIDDLDSNLHPYVVFGNEGSSSEFDPRQYGMEPLSVMAVVCNGQVVSAAIPQPPAAMLLTLAAVLRRLGRYQWRDLRRRGLHFPGRYVLPG